MPTLQALLNDIDLRYKNTFTNAQKVFWMNQVQKQIFQVVQHEAPPFYFALVKDLALYPLPADCDIKGIIEVALQTDAEGKNFKTLRYKRKDEEVDTEDRFYSIIERNLFINPLPDATMAGYKVYIYYTKRPSELSDGNLTAIPDIDEDYQELLIYGTIERIAATRKDTIMKNNYSLDFQLLLNEFKKNQKLEPECNSIPIL